MKRSKGMWVCDGPYIYKYMSENCTGTDAVLWNDGIGKLTGITMVKDSKSGRIMARFSSNPCKLLWQTARLIVFGGIGTVCVGICKIKNKICS